MTPALRTLGMIGIFGMFGAMLLAQPAAARDALPDDFVYLRDVAPTIAQDMRYAAPDNFTGKAAARL